MIYVIGNSHTRMFDNHKDFKTLGIGAATAHNINKEKSTTNSNRRLFEIINNIDKEKDSVILVLGEIDCRIHIYYQFKKNNEKYTISELMDNTIHNYNEVLKNLCEKGINFYVCGIPPSGWEENINKYQWYATPEIHCKIYREFNDKLKIFCNENKYKYLDIYSKTVDEKGFMKKEYAEDIVHLNSKALPFVIDMLKYYQEKNI